MLDPKDVRVGNWVIKVTGRDANGKAFFEYMPIAIDEYYFTWANYCFPINLTPPLLEICGFRPGSGGWYKNLQGNDREEPQVLRYNQDGGWFLNDCKLPLQPVYVHQLQNLYYALTGQELVIELSPYRNMDILLPVRRFFDPLKGALPLKAQS
ncbi:hypothetical protein V9K67_27135, partial [Paraflavisolibacter sp. H34]|uniref:hypothetical protein n=1 Tax=Huijunlia imazamoxiresistens TaxID=3127457 RepID=UPI00301B60FB